MLWVRLKFEFLLNLSAFKQSDSSQLLLISLLVFLKIYSNLSNTDSGCSLFLLISIEVLFNVDEQDVDNDEDDDEVEDSLVIVFDDKVANDDVDDV